MTTISDIADEIATRMTELQPLVDEHAQLGVALKALTSGDAGRAPPTDVTAAGERLPPETRRAARTATRSCSSSPSTPAPPPRRSQRPRASPSARCIPRSTTSRREASSFPTATA